MLFEQSKKYARSNLATFPLLWAAFCVTSTLAGWRRVQPHGPIHLWQRRCRHNHESDEVRDQLCLTKNLGISPPWLSLSSAIHVGLHITLFLKQRENVFKSPRSFGNQLHAFLHTTYSQDSQDSSSCACVPKSSVTFSLASACINGEKISETISTLPSCHHSVSSPLPSY